MARTAARHQEIREILATDDGGPDVCRPTAELPTGGPPLRAAAASGGLVAADATTGALWGRGEKLRAEASQEADKKLLGSVLRQGGGKMCWDGSGKALIRHLARCSRGPSESKDERQQRKLSTEAGKRGEAASKALSQRGVEAIFRQAQVSSTPGAAVAAVAAAGWLEPHPGVLRPKEGRRLGIKGPPGVARCGSNRPTTSAKTTNRRPCLHSRR